MATLAPMVDSGIAVSQPIAPVSNVGTALASIFTSTLKGPQDAPQPTEKEKEGAALSPFVKRLDELKNMNLTPDQYTASVRKVVRDQLVLTPEYRDGVFKIAGEGYGFTTEPVPTAAVDALTEGLNKHLTTPQGQLDLMSAARSKDGQFDEVATREELLSLYYKSKSEEVKLEKSNRELQIVKNDAEMYKTKSNEKFSILVVSWQDESQAIVDNLITNADEMSDPKTQLEFLTNARYAMESNFRSKANAAGIDPEVTRERLKEALAPIDSLIQTAKSNAENAGVALAALKNAVEYDLTKELLEANAMFGDPKFKEIVFSLFAEANKDDFAKSLQAIKDRGVAGLLDTFSLIPNIPNTPKESIDNSGTLANPEAVTNVKDMEKNSPGFIKDSMATSSKIIMDSDPQKHGELILQEFANVYVNSEALTTPLGNNALKLVLSPANIRKIAATVKQGGENGVDLKNTFTAFISQQIKKNKLILDGSPSGPVGYGYIIENGVVKITLRGKVVDDPTSLGHPLFVRKTDSETPESMLHAANNINTLMSAVARVVSDKTIPLDNKGTEGDILEYLLDSGAVTGGGGNTELGGSAGADTLANLVDRTEGGGDYSTLFGFSNRPGGAFEGVDISTMSLDELRAFSSGEYADWTKGQLGYVATPMGRYQFVGTTMDQVAKEMGLAGNTVFTPEVQDAMFHHLAKKVLSGATSPEAKRAAMRGTWEGFKSVSDSELDAAIAKFEGTEPPSYTELQKNMRTDVRTSTRPQGRGQGTASAVSTSPRPMPRESVAVDSGSGVEGTSGRGASQQATKGLSERTVAMLTKVGIDPAGVKQFASEEELKAAVSKGEVSQGDYVAVGQEVFQL